jgi:bifunctional non-homologous end joining protein LigD
MRQQAPSISSRESRRAPPAGMRITHPDRVIDKGSGLTKLDLVLYYESVGGRMLPHLKGRAVAEVRGPQGIGHPLFFQRNDPAGEAQDSPLQVNNGHQLLAAAQLNVIEFHTGNCRLRTPEKPDRVVFDLDPAIAPGVKALGVKLARNGQAD